MPGLTESPHDVDAPSGAVSIFSLWCERLAYLLLVVVVVVFSWRAATLDWNAAGDLSVIRLRALDVGTSNTPLVGPYSRFQWNHPGPMLSFAFAPWARLFGSSGVGILLGAFIVNLVAMFGATWVGISFLFERATVRRWFTAGALLVLRGFLGALRIFGVSFRAVQGWEEHLRLCEPLIQPTLNLMRVGPKPVMVLTHLNSADGTVANELIVCVDELGLDLRRTSQPKFVFGSEPAEYDALSARYWGQKVDKTPDPDLQRYLQLAENSEEIWVYYADTPPVVAN